MSYDKVKDLNKIIHSPQPRLRGDIRQFTNEGPIRKEISPSLRLQKLKDIHRDVKNFGVLYGKQKSTIEKALASTKKSTKELDDIDTTVANLQKELKKIEKNIEGMGGSLEESSKQFIDGQTALLGKLLENKHKKLEINAALRNITDDEAIEFIIQSKKDMDEIANKIDAKRVKIANDKVKELAKTNFKHIAKALKSLDQGVKNVLEQNLGGTKDPSKLNEQLHISQKELKNTIDIIEAIGGTSDKFNSSFIDEIQSRALSALENLEASTNRTGVIREKLILCCENIKKNIDNFKRRKEHIEKLIKSMTEENVDLNSSVVTISIQDSYKGTATLDDTTVNSDSSRKKVLADKNRRNQVTIDLEFSTISSASQKPAVVKEDLQLVEDVKEAFPALSSQLEKVLDVQSSFVGQSFSEIASKAEEDYQLLDKLKRISEKDRKKYFNSILEVEGEYIDETGYKEAYNGYDPSSEMLTLIACQIRDKALSKAQADSTITVKIFANEWNPSKDFYDKNREIFEQYRTGLNFKVIAYYLQGTDKQKEQKVEAASGVFFTQEVNRSNQREISILSDSKVLEYTKIESDQFIYLSDRGEISEWVQHNAIDQVFVQANYMSGDRYAIAISTAMVTKIKSGILIITSSDESSIDRAKELARFYNTVLKGYGQNRHKQNRIAIFNTGESGQKSARSEYKYYEARFMATREEYYKTISRSKVYHKHKINNYSDDSDNIFKIPAHATKVVVGLFDSRSQHHDKDYPTYLAWRILGEDTCSSGDRKVPEAKKIDEYLSRCLPRKGKIALILTKAFDEATVGHLHHSTDPDGLKQIIQAAQNAGRHPVLVGDIPHNWQSEASGGNVTELWDFWNHKHFPQELKQKGRVGQLAFYRHLATSPTRDVIFLGLRSGVLEGAAYFGMPTIYMEEKGNQSASRLEKLFQPMPHFHRLILDQPAGKDQQAVLAQELEKRIDTINQSRPKRIREFCQGLRDVIGDDYKISDEQGLDILNHFKEKYTSFIHEEVKKLRNDNNRKFSQTDINLMTRILKFSREDLKTGKKIPDQKLAHVNPSYAMMFCQENRDLIKQHIDEMGIGLGD